MRFRRRPSETFREEIRRQLGGFPREFKRQLRSFRGESGRQLTPLGDEIFGQILGMPPVRHRRRRT